jgi:hypothetical protein
LIPESGIVIANTSVQHVIQDDYKNPQIQQQIDSFNAGLAERLDDSNFIINSNVTNNPLDIYDGDEPSEIDESNATPDIDDIKEEVLDKYIGTTFLLDPTRNENNVATRVKVIELRKDSNGRPIGIPHNN